MKFGLKKIFKRKSKTEKVSTTTTPTKSSTPVTPSTQPVNEDDDSAVFDERRDDGPPAYSAAEQDLPPKNLLEELNVHASGLAVAGDTELVLGEESSMDVPDDEEPYEVPDNNSGWYVEEEAELEVEVAETELQDVTPESMDSASEEMSADSPLRPRQLDPSGKIARDDESIAEPLGPQLFEKKEEKGIADTIMNMLEKATACVFQTEPIQRLVPTADNALCSSIRPGQVRSDLSANRPKLVRQYSYYDETFALKILDELVNVGYALVNHQQTSDDNENGDEEGDWVGRSVTLILKPGTCNSRVVQAPYLEWSTLGGGQQSGIETTAVSLLDIHSIASSNIEDMEMDDGENPNNEAGKDDDDDDEEEKEDLQCFFSLTTKQGQIYVMEAITADESQRLVAGIKNLASRLSKQLVAGDKAVLSDFFDNSQDSDDIRVTEEEAMNRVSHLMLDRIMG